MSVYYPQGRYLCQVTDQAIGEAGTGTPQVAIKFRVLETEAGDPVDQQYERTAYLFLSEAAAPRTIEVLKELGYDRDSFRYLDKGVTGAQDLGGVQFVGFCVHDAYNGNEKEKWGIATEGGGLEVKPMEAKKIRDLDALFGKHLKGGVSKSAPDKRTQSAVAVADEGPPNTPFGDQDVPF